MDFFYDDANQNFEYRNTNRVDGAQLRAEQYFTQKKIYWRHFGTDPKDDNPIPREEFLKMPRFIQKSPDMFAINNNFVFVEVKGCKDKLSIKLDDYREYVKWHDIAPLMFFIFSGTLDQTYLFYLEALESNIEYATMGRYKDNNKVYWSIPVKYFDDFKVTL